MSRGEKRLCLKEVRTPLRRWQKPKIRGKPYGKGRMDEKLRRGMPGTRWRNNNQISSFHLLIKRRKKTEKKGGAPSGVRFVQQEKVANLNRGSKRKIGGWRKT